MKAIRVAIVSLGSLKYPVDLPALARWQSDIFKIIHGSSIGHLPNAEGQDWEYSDSQLSELVQADPAADCTVALINARLEDNYYIRRLNRNVAVLSLYEMAEIMRFYNFTLENFILRNVYELAVLYAANGGLIPEDAYSWAHDDIRGCLFDMNANKPDIVFSMHKPTLCHDCTNKVHSRQIDPNLLPTLNKELTRLQKALYFRVVEWVKVHPLYALAITAAFGICLNLAASILFEMAKPAISWLN